MLVRACVYHANGASHWSSSTSLIHNAVMTDCLHAGILGLEVEGSESCRSARRFCASPDGDNARQPPKAATYSVTMGTYQKCALSLTESDGWRKCIKGAWRRENKNKKQEAACASMNGEEITVLETARVCCGTSGLYVDFLDSHVTSSSVSLLIQYIKHLFCCYTLDAPDQSTFLENMSFFLD